MSERKTTGIDVGRTPRIAWIRARALRRVGCVTAACVLSLSSRLAVAADPLAEFSLEWEAPGTCPPRSAMEQELRRDIAGSLVAAVPLRARVAISQLATNRFAVSIIADAATGRSKRQLEANTCAELINAVSLILATIVDPEGVAQRAQAQTTQPSGPDESAAQAPQIRSTRALSGAPAAHHARSGFDVSASNQQKPRANTDAPGPTAFSPAPTSGLSTGPSRQYASVAGWVDLDVGSLPNATEAFGGLLAMSSGGLRVEGSLGWWRHQPKHWDQAPNPGAGANFEMWAGSVSACVRAYRRAWFAFYPCAGLEYRELAARANASITEPGAAKRRGFAPIAGTLALLDLTNWLALRATAGLVFPLDRPVFIIDGLGDLHQPSSVALRVGIGVEVHFP